MQNLKDPLIWRVILALLTIAAAFIFLSLAQNWSAARERINHDNNQTQKICRVNQCFALSQSSKLGVSGKPRDQRAEKINQFLASTSADGFGGEFTSWADVYGVDAFLLVAIGVLESGWYRHCVGGNCFGICSGCVSYPSLEVGIRTAAKILGRPPYRALSSYPPDIEAIGKIWARDVEWAEKVGMIYEEVKTK